MHERKEVTAKGEALHYKLELTHALAEGPSP